MSEENQTLLIIGLLLLGLAVVSLFAGCSALDRYERTYQATWDADAQTGGLAITLRPVAGVGGGGQSAAAISDATIERIVRLVEADRRRDVASLTREIPEIPEKGVKK